MIDFFSIRHLTPQKAMGSAPDDDHHARGQQIQMALTFSNWGRQNTQSLQAVLAVAPLKKGKAATGKCEIFVCVCVCPSHFFAAYAESGSKLMLGVHRIDFLQKLCKGYTPAKTVHKPNRFFTIVFWKHAFS